MGRKSKKITCFIGAMFGSLLIANAAATKLGLAIGAFLLLMLVGVLYWSLLFVFDRDGNRQRGNALRHAFGFEKRD